MGGGNAFWSGRNGRVRAIAGKLGGKTGIKTLRIPTYTGFGRVLGRLFLGPGYASCPGVCEIYSIFKFSISSTNVDFPEMVEAFGVFSNICISEFVQTSSKMKFKIVQNRVYRCKQPQNERSINAGSG